MTWYARRHRLPQRDEEYHCEKCGVSSKIRVLNVMKDGKYYCDGCKL